MSGIFVTKGTRVSVPAGGLVIGIGDSGAPTTSLTLHVSYDMYPQWLRIALEHAEACQKAATEVDRLWTNGSGEGEIAALEAEMRSGMQACLAAGAALDGFYGTLVELAPPPDATRKAWEEKALARFKQVAELIRLTTKFPPTRFEALRESLKIIFALRNEAVHPTGASRAPFFHPRLKIWAEYRLANFRAENALGAAESAINIIGGSLSRAKAKNRAVVEHFQIAQGWISPIADKWEADTGRKLGFER